MIPALLKSCSDGTLVGGTERKILANILNDIYRCLLAFHHANGSASEGIRGSATYLSMETTIGIFPCTSSVSSSLLSFSWKGCPLYYFHTTASTALIHEQHYCFQCSPFTTPNVGLFRPLCDAYHRIYPLKRGSRNVEIATCSLSSRQPFGVLVLSVSGDMI